jgi:hypothetical protein
MITGRPRKTQKATATHAMIRKSSSNAGTLAVVSGRIP